MLSSLLRRKLLGLLSFVVLTVLVLNPAGMAQALTLHVTDDSYINTVQGNLDTNYGGENIVKVYDNRRLGIIRFDITDFRARFNVEDVVSARLRLYIKSINTNGSVRFATAFDDFQENQVKFNNFPRRGGVSAYLPLDKDSSETDVDSLVFVDVAEQLKIAMTRGQDYFAMSMQGDNVNPGQGDVVVEFASKEDHSHAMQLEIVTNEKERLDLQDERIRILQEAVNNLSNQINTTNDTEEEETQEDDVENTQ